MAKEVTKEDAEKLGDGGEGEALTRELMRQHLDVLINAEEAAKKSRAARKSARKKVGVDIKLKIIDQVIAMMDWEPAEVREWLETLVLYMDLSGLMPGRNSAAEPELFPVKDPEEQSKEDWKLRGYLAAVTGRGAPGTPPKECPGDRVQDWMEGWNTGQLKNAPAKLEPKLEVVK